ncbi:Hypothetical predicted protein [Lecanosticta acicola]|uniref:Uncharacterized protein n=1 Tax=Lecanosticta acicola TaxID=111012 RepID=A0AAI9EFI2_9PEZI|nr:Hypothetical predicted protein [Lecanosticta acicola]
MSVLPFAYSVKYQTTHDELAKLIKGSSRPDLRGLRARRLEHQNQIADMASSINGVLVAMELFQVEDDFSNGCTTHRLLQTPSDRHI